jgi:hypothetical protein
MMRKLLLGLALLLAACSQEAPPPPPPPVNAVQPQEIDYLAIKEGKLYGAGCNFVAEGGGIAALALAQEKEAIIKLKGKIVRIPADTGSQILPETARTRYAGPEYILILAPIPGTPRTENGVIQSLATSLTILDPQGRTQFFAKGQVQCKPM